MDQVRKTQERKQQGGGKKISVNRYIWRKRIVVRVTPGGNTFANCYSDYLLQNNIAQKGNKKEMHTWPPKLINLSRPSSLASVAWIR